MEHEYSEQQIRWSVGSFRPFPLLSVLGFFDTNGGVLRDRHLDLRGNLIKAMMVVNWLNMLEVEAF